MAMRTATPWFITLNTAIGLFLVFLGERAFGHDARSYLITWAGMLFVLSAVITRGIAYARSSGKKRSVEFVQLLCTIGVVVALVLYSSTTSWGIPLPGEGSEKFDTIVTVLWTVFLLCSFLPLVMMEISLGVARRSEIRLIPDYNPEEGDEASVDLYRVSTVASSGLTIALAASFLMVTCNIASQRDVRKDVSYFKTSSPGEATVNHVKASGAPIKVLLFYPDVNEVKEELERYFKDLADESGNMTVESVNLYRNPGLATDYGISKEDQIVFVYDEPIEEDEPEGDGKKPTAAKKVPKHENLRIDNDIEKARRNQLRTLDEKVQKSIKTLIAPRRTACLTVGHGEITHPSSIPMFESPIRGTRIVKALLSRNNYQIKELGRQDTTVAIPNECAVLIVLGPAAPLLPDELDSIDRYLGVGGSLFLALDAEHQGIGLGVLEGRLGVHFDDRPLIDPRPVRAQNDLLKVIATSFSSHAAMTTLSRYGAKEGVAFYFTGSLEDAEFTELADPKKKPKRTYVVNSNKRTFRAVVTPRGGIAIPPNRETKAYNLAAAIEDPAAVPPAGEDGPIGSENGMRAIVFADVQPFNDMLMQQGINQNMFNDAVKWLAGEEHLQGTTNREKDIRIKHTQSRDAKWFYGSIVGAPLLILGLGLGFVGFSRRRRRRAS